MVSYTTSIINILSSVTNLKQISRLMKIFIITPNLVDNGQSAPLVWQILPHVKNNCISILMNIFTPLFFSLACKKQGPLPFTSIWFHSLLCFQWGPCSSSFQFSVLCSVFFLVYFIPCLVYQMTLDRSFAFLFYLNFISH